MNYYDQLYDIDFLSGDHYIARCGDAEIEIGQPGIPVGARSGTDHVTFETGYGVDGARLATDFFRSHDLTGDEDLQSLLTLVRAEDAYRNRDADDFFGASRVLASCSDANLRRKAEKLTLAWRTSCSLSPEERPLDAIRNHILTFLKREYDESYGVTDIAVETPVKIDWERRGYSLENPDQVLDFYRTTSSYILELAAANHQVETLCNYAVVIDWLREFGVQRIWDYGAGIGTFTIVAAKSGLEVIYSDLESRTMAYARRRLADLGLSDVKQEVLKGGHEPELPENLECIVCTEVLEHVFEPEVLIGQFRQSLSKGGVLVVSESFDYIEEFCTHLPKHKGKGGTAFIDFMSSVGFAHVPTRFEVHPKIFVKL